MDFITDKPVNVRGERVWRAMPVRGRRCARGAVAVWCVWLLACVLLLASGVVYKVLAGHLGRLDSFISP